MNKEKPWLPKLRRISDPLMWEAYNEMLDHYIGMHQRKLEQSSEPIDLYRAQGSLYALKALKSLKDEINAQT
jgi:hypothetical protein